MGRWDQYLAVGNLTHWEDWQGRLPASTFKRILEPISDLCSLAMPAMVPVVVVTCEASVHAVRAFIHSQISQSGTAVKVLLKIHYSNAVLNSIRRDHILRRIKEIAPPAYYYAYQSYAH